MLMSFPFRLNVRPDTFSRLVEYLRSVVERFPDARTGGETVYVSPRHPNGLTGEDYRDLLRQHPEARRWRWQVMRRDAGVYVKGRIRHPDHRTVLLDRWHRVLLNRETEAPAMRHVAFLD